MALSSKQLRRNRIFYGFGVVGTTIFDTFIGSFLTLFATDVLGLDALYFASLLIAPKIVDIAIDFFIMYFIGKTRTRFGMYRPWLLNMIAMVVALITIFSVPFLNVGRTAMLSIIVIAYFACNSICSSFYWISYKAMPGVMTENENELIRLSSTKTIFEYIFSIVASALTMPILLSFGRYEGDYRNPTGWLAAALIFGGFSLISSLLCFAFVRTDAELERKMTGEYSARDVFSDYKNVFSDKGFLAITSLLFLTYLATYTNQTVSYYYYICNLGIEDIISYIMLLAAVFAVFASVMTGKLHERFGLKHTLIIGAVSLIISAVCMMVAYSVWMVIVMGFFQVVGTTILTTLIFSLWPVVAKNLNPEKVRSPLNSTVGASNVFGNFGIILGNTLGAALVTFSRYNAELPVQDCFTLKVFRYSTPAITIVLSAVMIAVVLRSNRKGTVE